MSSTTWRANLKATSNGRGQDVRNVCTSAVVKAFCGAEHLSGRYLHCGDDVRRALREFGYSVRSIKTLAERQVRCKSGLKVSQVERLYEAGSLDGACRPGEFLVGVVWGVKRHTGCRFLDTRHDTAHRPGARVLTLYGVYATRDERGNVTGRVWDHVFHRAEVSA